jgi:hypothetical protein
MASNEQRSDDKTARKTKVVDKDGIAKGVDLFL